MTKRLNPQKSALAGALVLALPILAPAQTAAPSSNPVQPATREAQALPSLAPLVESVKGAVVNVDVQAKASRSEGFGQDNPLFDRFFGNGGGGQGQRREQLRQGAGSGFIIDPKGLVLTNNHVIEGAVTIRVRMDDGRSFDAKIVGRDPLTDVALIQLQGKVENLPFVKLGDSDALRVGDWLLAIGNPFGLASSVSSGILSARARDIHSGPYDDFLQTDAAINPGNSGGPLFNMKGEVVGINTAIVGGGTGIGFAVPSNMVKALLPQLEKDGAVTRAWLGIGIQDLTGDLAKAMSLPVNEGAIVSQVNDNSPAGKAGMRADDVIVAIDGRKVGSGGELTRTVALKKPGTTSVLDVFRDGKRQELKVQLGTRPDLEGVSVRQRRGGDEETEQSSKARVGVSLSNVDPRIVERTGLTSTQGALVTDVLPGSPAERAELEPGMVVVEVDRKPVRNAEELAKLIRKASPGSTLLLRVETPGGGRFLRALRVP
ncbi:trypsin-like peptidase domain-containing protein [Archangium violaceum]|uniref:trypsin-like peptidase domain-containing protein n=1 Tax=Archangium violaceum TaxID=83451 RepID=UPI00194F1732|nr:trypsin-like peptidase domain-containing protein [Archangium violaceum]QRN93907.1 trypsin-like peptidase domain-containing protein [Archangium violaceum]